MISWLLPIETVSEGNSSENRFVKAKRHDRQKKSIKVKFLQERPQINLPVEITLTRIAPRSLDAHDNLRMSMKWIADAIADNLIPGKAAGRADDSKEISWEYNQEKGKPREYAIKIEIKPCS